jgi:hypothetical protein
VSDALSLALLTELKIRELSQRRQAVRPRADEDEPTPPVADGLTGLNRLSHVLTRAISLLLAVRIQIVIAR